MRIPTFQNMRDALPGVANHVLNQGSLVSPRGQDTRELLNYTLKITDPTDTLPTKIGRGLSLPMAAVEAAQLVAGVSAPELVLRINPTFDRFIKMHTDPGRAMGDGDDPPVTTAHQHGAYGPRIAVGLEKIEASLLNDRDSRQALVNIWSADKDYIKDPDIPCTIALQFMIREDKLNLHVYMRSNDVWWGLTYDAFQFTQVQCALANALGIEVGEYYHTASSMHIYMRDVEAIDGMIDSAKFSSTPNNPGALGVKGAGIAVAMKRTAILIEAGLFADASDRVLPPGANLTPTEQWYLKQLSYTSPRSTQ